MASDRPVAAIESPVHAGRSLAPDGSPSGPNTPGLLQRAHIASGEIRYIGKESNRFEEIEAGIIHSGQNIYTEYPDPRRNEWETKVSPALRRLAEAYCPSILRS